MNRARFVNVYILIPTYLFLAVACLTAIGVLMSIDEEKYTPLAIVLFCAYGILIAAMLVIMKFPLRKLALKCELARYDFDDDDAADKEEYIFEHDEYAPIVFRKEGLYVDDKFTWYNHMRFYVAASHLEYHVGIIIMIESEKFLDIVLPFNRETRHMIQQFGIQVVNQHVFDYLVNNKKEAFEQILKHGKIV